MKLYDRDADNAELVQTSKISEVHRKVKGRINPVIVTFQNGEINSDQTENMKVNLLPNDFGNTQIEVETNYGHKFVQTNTKEESRATQFLAIRNKKTNKMRIVEVDSALLINSELLHVKNIENSSSSKSKEDDYNKLNKTFGGKKINARLEKKELLNLNSALVIEDMKDIVDGMVKTNDNDITLSQTIETESITDLLPPCNRSATNVHDVYILSKILNSEELNALKEEILKEDFDTKSYSEFFITCLAQIQNEKSNNYETNLAGIFYAELLIKFLKIPSKQLKNKNTKFDNCPPIIYTKLIKEFCITTGNTV
ncbi:DNA-directed RNA polymerase I-associated factor 53 kDa subunit, putative [Pediculus humanus corporis]|uniref:DNA-directed RNA polymerase I-associated factor 53 kDa subunit, putative n=1 Tax=Pediculus humanus subsp. corporis TaxID=121224 RepID=E0VIS9_PEDHC|nr:DNA-directed RNA polymerase I-associated factor 53 kDa subunit, putative [Pediculus humanus corporis]EEB13285.1 DNA-directed RNA polymerase I-associated factor 53 kDa subunit, putative [Pediculus humanus corporis]